MAKPPPWKVTKRELDFIARNTGTSTRPEIALGDRMLAALRVRAALEHAGVPEELQPDAAAEAEFRWAFASEPESAVPLGPSGQRLLRVVTGKSLGRDPWPGTGPPEERKHGKAEKPVPRRVPRTKRKAKTQ